MRFSCGVCDLATHTVYAVEIEADDYMAAVKAALERVAGDPRVLRPGGSPAQLSCYRCMRVGPAPGDPRIKSGEGRVEEI
jgi:hypothetical protein